MNLLDRMISYVAPAAGARRMMARLSMDAAMGRVTGVRTAAGGREGTMGNWNPRRYHRFEEGASFFKAMERAESLVANDSHAVSAVESLALNIVGSGMRPQSYPDWQVLGITEEQADEFAESAERAWALWCEKAGADDMLSFEDIQYQAIRSMLTTGEFLHLNVWRDEPDRVFGMCIQPLHPARLRTPVDKIHDSNIHNGVEFGRHGEPVAYWIATPQGDAALAGLTSKDFIRVERLKAGRIACLHRFRSVMPEAVRGTSVLAPAMKQFRDLADYVDYELVGALIAASFTVFIETAAPLAGGGFGGGAAAPAPNYSAQLQPGTVTMGAAGHKPHIISSNRPGPQFDAFYERVLRSVASSTGQPYESVAKDFSKTNYSSARAALLEVWKLHTLYQDWFVRSVQNPYYRMVLEEAWERHLLAVPSGAPAFLQSPAITRAWSAAVWTRPPRGQIDPVKEREADNLALGNMTETRTAICHSRGLDFATVARTRQRENRLLARLGLSTETAAPSARTETGENDD